MPAAGHQGYPLGLAAGFLLFLKWVPGVGAIDVSTSISTDYARSRSNESPLGKNCDATLKTLAIF
jgi:hypothetical protein